MLLRTAHGLYECMRPSTSYRKIYTPLEEQLEICAQVRAA